VRVRPPWVVATFPVLALAVYGPILTTGFLADDLRLVWRVATGHWALGQGGFFRPLVIGLYALDFTVWGREAVGYHATNLLLHVLNSVLVGTLSVQLLRWVGLADVRWPAIAAAAFFLVLPSHSESVTWIAGRTDLLATAGMLLALIAYVAWRRGGRRGLIGLALTAFALALLAKESAMVLPAVVVIVEAVAGTPRHALRSALAFGAVLAGYVVVRAWVLGSWIGGYGVASHLAITPEALIGHILTSAARVYTPPWPPALVGFVAWAPPWLALSALVLALFVPIAYVWRRAPPWVARLGLLAVLGFLCTIPLLGDQGVELLDTRGERFLYTPSVFAVIGLGGLLTWIGQRKRGLAIALAVSCTTLFSLALVTVNADWRRASVLAHELTETVASAATAHRVVVVNLPADYRGRWVFFVGLPEALIFHGIEGARLEILSAHSVGTLQEATELQRVAGGCQFSRPDGPVPHLYDTPAASLEARDATGFRFRLTPEWRDAKLLVFSEGTFHDADPAMCR
jgi:hypothetical protein